VVAEEQIDYATTDQKREHWLTYHLEKNAQEAALFRRGQFVEAVLLQSL
jgi:hypothetical protein